MNRLVKYIWSVMVLSTMVFHQGLLAQSVTDALRFKDRFEQKVTNLHQEKVFVHVDRDAYITGETIWMSAYCVDAAVHIPVDLSKVLNVELIDESGKPVKQTRIRLAEGLGMGQIFVSPDIVSGHYVLRAYTNWMKNFSSDLVFEKELWVVNPSSITTNESVVNESLDINFFPEGGTLVSGLKSKVAIKVTDHYGNGVSLTGIVYDREDNEITEFTTSELGYGYFYLTPESTNSYTARILQDSIIKKFQLPEIQESGMTIAVRNSNSGGWNITVDQTRGFVDNSYLVVHARGVLKNLIPLDSSKKDFNIRENELPEGISHITLFNNSFVPMCERLIFKYPQQEPLQLTVSKSEFKQREKVNLRIDLDKQWKKEDLAHLSVSVSRGSSLDHVTKNMISYLLLTSDLTGNVPDPWTFFDPDNKLRKEQIDLVMLTNGWRRFDWDKINSDENISLKYPAEINAPILSGELKKRNPERKPKSVQVNFSGRESVMNSIDLNDDGLFHLEVPFRVSAENVIFFTDRDTLNSDELSVFSPFDLDYHAKRRFNQKLPLESKVYFETLNTNTQISQLYRDHSNINGLQNEVLQQHAPFYGIPDHLYYLDNYTRFETIQDLFIEYIRSAVIRDNNKTRGFHVVYDGGLLSGNALTLIDGVPIFDFDYILNFDPLLIEKISVVNDVYRMGSIGYPGIIEFTTYKGDFDGQELPEYLVEKVYHGLQVPRIFYSPQYTSDQQYSRIPDYRNTLYWNPQVEVGSDGASLEFYTSDDAGLYQIEVNGITSKGKPIYLRGNFKVTPSVN